MIIIKSIILFIFLILFPIVHGGLITHFIDEKCGLFSHFIFGYLIDFAVFELFCVPAIILKVSLSVFVDLIIVLYVICACISCYINKEKIKSFFKKKDGVQDKDNHKSNIFTTNGILACIVVVLIMIQTFVSVFYMHEDDDDVFYVGTAVTGVYDNSMFRINPRTGVESKSPEWKYVVSPFPIYLATIAKVSHIHPTIVAHTIFPAVFIPLCYAVYFEISKKLFKGDMKSRLLFMIFLNFIYIFGNYSIRSNFTFLLFRVWQGKAMLANYVIPMFWLIWMMQEEDDNKLLYLLYISASLAGMLTSSMGTTFPPMIIGVLSLLRWYKDRDTKKFIKTMACFAVVILYGLPYILSRI